jgi:hypothetical protein
MHTSFEQVCYAWGVESPLGHVNPHQNVSRLRVGLDGHAGRPADDDRVAGSELVDDSFGVVEQDAELTSNADGLPCDSVDDAHAADSVGAGCVLYSGGFTDSERLRATGKLVARSLSEAVELIYA